MQHVVLSQFGTAGADAHPVRASRAFQGLRSQQLRSFGFCSRITKDSLFGRTSLSPSSNPRRCRLSRGLLLRTY